MEKEELDCVSVTQASREFLFLIEVLKVFRPPYKSKRHWPWFMELPIQSKQKRIVSLLCLCLCNTKLTISFKNNHSIIWTSQAASSPTDTRNEDWASLYTFPPGFGQLYTSHRGPINFKSWNHNTMDHPRRDYSILYQSSLLYTI